MNNISTKPEKEFKIGAVRAAIWSNPRTRADGSSFNSYKVIVDRVYKDAQGGFQKTQSMDVHDVPKAILALKKAYEFMTMGDTKTAAPIATQPISARVEARVP
ncbi:hypothetical protein ACFL1X_01450 [Candidatus Hydrogenedentota bacterium]